VLGRRLLVLVAVLMGLTALAASVAPREMRTRPDGAVAPPGAPIPTPRPAEPEAAGRDPVMVAGEPPVQPLDAAREDQVIEAEVGERVRIEVSADELSSVQIGQDGPIEPIDPAAPARFDLLYTRPARLPIRIVTPDPTEPRTIGVLRVRAAS
jgi:hypothetical protein